MFYRVVLSPDAKADLRSAIRWYVNIDMDLSFRFAAALDAILNRIAQHPNQFPLVRGPLRRAVMKRFPYSVYFKVKARTVYVASIDHQRRS